MSTSLKPTTASTLTHFKAVTKPDLRRGKTIQWRTEYLYSLAFPELATTRGGEVETPCIDVCLSHTTKDGSRRPARIRLSVRPCTKGGTFTTTRLMGDELTSGAAFSIAPCPRYDARKLAIAAAAVDRYAHEIAAKWNAEGLDDAKLLGAQAVQDARNALGYTEPVRLAPTAPVVPRLNHSGPPHYKTRAMILMTQAIRDSIPPIYAQQNVPELDRLIYAKFFTPWGAGTWYAVEGEPVNASGDSLGVDGDSVEADFKFYGYVTGLACNEWGYFSLAEMANVVGIAGLQMERDRHYCETPKRIGDDSRLAAEFEVVAP